MLFFVNCEVSKCEVLKSKCEAVKCRSRARACIAYFLPRYLLVHVLVLVHVPGTRTRTLHIYYIDLEMRVYYYPVR